VHQVLLQMPSQPLLMYLLLRKWQCMLLQQQVRQPVLLHVLHTAAQAPAGQLRTAAAAAARLVTAYAAPSHRPQGCSSRQLAPCFAQQHQQNQQQRLAVAAVALHIQRTAAAAAGWVVGGETQEVGVARKRCPLLLGAAAAAAAAVGLSKDVQLLLMPLQLLVSCPSSDAALAL
jgi:hypothetical protein